MIDKQLKEIQDRLDDLETRISSLENLSGSGTPKKQKDKSGRDKQQTLREIIKGKKFRNGPEKIAAIVGYFEIVLGVLIKKEEIAKIWKESKLDGTYKTNLLDAADGLLIRVNKDGDCDLTQSGEDFFEELIKHESSNPTSK